MHIVLTCSVVRKLYYIFKCWAIYIVIQSQGRYLRLAIGNINEISFFFCIKSSSPYFNLLRINVIEKAGSERILKVV